MNRTDLVPSGARARAPGGALPPAARLPAHCRPRHPRGAAVDALKRRLRVLGLHTVCEEARCPNLGGCFSRGTATFMLLGAICTRTCRFCAVTTGAPKPVDPEEPRRVARAVAELGLRHAVLTSVNRDDLRDGGASWFARTVLEIRSLAPRVTIEVLTPDFKGNGAAVDTVLEARPDVYNHNLETVVRLQSRVRPGARYGRSLGVLARVKRRAPRVLTKSGLMLGLGETRGEVREALLDLRAVGCDALTLGQYLRPSLRHLEVARYLDPAEFAELEREALELGFAHVASGPLVRSSFHAEGTWRELLRRA